MLERVATIYDRDPELMERLKAFFREHLAVQTVDLDPVTADWGSTSIKRLRKDADIAVILPKLMTAKKKNKKLFKKLKKSKLRFLNSLSAVKTCQSRFQTFKRARSAGIRVPRFYRKWKKIKKAFKKGKVLWVRKDAHNIPKEERVLGIARDLYELDQLVQNHDPGELFFQEYLGIQETTFKAYVIGQRVFCLKKKGTQDGITREISQVTLRRVEPLPAERALVLHVGTVFKMAVYGVDYFYHEGQPVIVDINDFPSFRGIEEAVPTISAYIHETFLREDRPSSPEPDR